MLDEESKEDKKLKTKIEKLLFEDPFEEKTARILIKYPLVDSIRIWLNRLLERKGTKYRENPSVKNNEKSP